MTETVLELQNVSKTYRMGEVNVNALQGITLKIRRHEFVAIMGPSGSGKSTLMNMIGCLDLPSDGRILLEGHDISKLSESHLATIRGKKIGFIFQKFNLINSMSAQENVELPMIFQGIPEEERTEKAKTMLEQVGLGKRMTHRPTELSGGEQQRVAIARALVGSPSFIMADEPTGNLDSKTGAEIIDFFEKLHDDGQKTIVMVTHDPNIAKHAHRIIRIKDGMLEKGE